MIHDPVNHPRHYQSASGIECIDVAEHLSFNLGNAFKYVFRRDQKGNPLQDLEKARWYIARERLRWQRFGDTPPPRPIDFMLNAAIEAIAEAETGELGLVLALIGRAAWSPTSRGDLARADVVLAREIVRLKSDGGGS